MFICIEILGLTNIQSFASSKKIELTTSEATLTIDQKGNLRIIQNKERIIQVNTSIYNLWRITLKNNLSGRESVIVPDKSIKLVKSGDIIQMRVESFVVDDNALPGIAEFSISVKDDAFCFSGSLKSESEGWIFKELVYPDISGIEPDDNNLKIYWPNEFGQCFDDPQVFGSRSFEYPSVRGTMSWFSVNSHENGLYIGCHDHARGAKKFSLAYNDDKSFKSNVLFPVNSGEFVIPDVMIMPYSGKWYTASGFYRGWYEKNFRIVDVAPWARNCEGYMLNILKQQNGEVMYTYNDIDKLCDIAEKLNFKLIGLWGRGVGGHDRLYPNYMPDNLLGGREEMKKAIERAHERGFKVIVYSNGKIMDTSTDYYYYNGIETIVLNERKRPELEIWKKHVNTTPVIFAVACPGSALWRKTILDLAIDAESLGADAFYVDQLAQIPPVSFMCYSENHDHKLPQEAFTKYRVKMMHDIRKTMKKINPGFSVMTEGINDAMLSDLDFFQGVPHVTTSFVFPEMFRYTFPEVIAVTLNADPGLHRYDANFSTVYGLRHQIMSRYPADVDYLQHGKIPTEESYSNITGPPDIKKFTEDSAEEVTAYTHDLFQFENDNADYFRSGKFIDEDGIEVAGNEIMGKGFLNGSKMGVVIWNKHLSEKRDFSVSVPGYRLIKATEPGKAEVSASSPLDANSIRLLIFEKN